MVYGTAGEPTTGDKGGFFSVMIYKTGAGIGNWIIGGGIGGYYNVVEVQPDPATYTNLQITMVPQTSADYQIYGITILGM